MVQEDSINAFFDRYVVEFAILFIKFLAITKEKFNCNIYD